MQEERKRSSFNTGKVNTSTLLLALSNLKNPLFNFLRHTVYGKSVLDITYVLHF